MARSFVSLEAIFATTKNEPMTEARKAPHEFEAKGCASSGCGSAQGADELDPEVWEKVKDHPCYSEEAHHYFARMHVAVAPACNIQCNYCNRKYDCANESRPGVVSERLTPSKARGKFSPSRRSVPQLSVLGIAGPGDALYDWRHTKATFELVAKLLPDIKLCISTNGLALPDHVDEIVDMNIDHVTITINMVDPEIGAKIYPWIFYQAQAPHRPGGGADSARAADARTRNAHRAQGAGQSQFGDDPRRERRASHRGQSRGQSARRVPAQHHAADLRSGARNLFTA